MYIKHKDFCKCDHTTGVEKCEFCMPIKQIRAYKYREHIGQLPPVGKENFEKLKAKFEEITKQPFANYGKPKQPGEVKIQDKEEHSNVSADTFAYENNKLFIKDSRNVTILVINLKEKSIYSTLENAKYSLKNPGNPEQSMLLKDIFNNMQMLDKIKDIIRK